MNEKLVHVQDMFLNRINQICNKLGLNNIIAQLYVILYLSDRPLSLDDMVERLEISKGSASINMRALERYGAARRAWIKGSRRDYYEAEADIPKVIMDRIKSIARDRLLEIEEMISSSYQAVNTINPSNKEESEVVAAFKQKIETLQKLYKKARSLFDLFDSDILNHIVLNNKAKRDNKKEVLAIK